MTLDVGSWWHLSCARCDAVLMQRPDLGPLLSWSLATIVMDLAYGVHWVARTQKMTLWTIFDYCTNLGLCRLQPVPCYWTWPLLFYDHVHSPSLVIGHSCVRECADPSKCLSYLIKVFVLLAPTFCWLDLDWLDLALWVFVHKMVLPLCGSFC